MSKQRILVIGATGRVGSEIINQLRDRESLEVFAGIRNKELIKEYQDSGLHAVHIDLDDRATIEAAVQNIDSVLLLTGYSVDMLKQSKRVVDSSKKAGVKHIVHIGASGNETAEVAHWGWHRMIESYIEQQGFNFTHIRPEAFMQNILAFGWLNEGGVVNLLKDAAWSWVDTNDVAAIAAEALASPQRFENQVWRLGYEKASIQQVTDKINNKFELNLSVAPLDPNKFYEAAVANGADATYMSCIRDQFLLNGEGKIPDADITFDEEVFKEAVGRYPSTWKDFLARESSALQQAAAS